MRKSTIYLYYIHLYIDLYDTEQAECEAEAFGAYSFSQLLKHYKQVFDLKFHDYNFIFQKAHPFH